MYAITGITGQIGSKVAEHLRDLKLPVRAVVRDRKKGKVWEAKGCEFAVADLNDPPALAEALKGVDGAFILLPPNFDPLPGFPEVKALAESVLFALNTSQPKNVVYLSTIGAQATTENLLTQHSIAEKTLRNSVAPITFLRPAWFMENSRWDIESARQNGTVASFLHPLDRKIPMVATADIAQAAANWLQTKTDLQQVMELEGPRRYSPNDIALAFSEVLHKEVRMELVPRESWEALFRSQGVKNPLPRMRMLDGFNEGWIDFESGQAGSRKGTTEIETVLRSLTSEGAVH